MKGREPAVYFALFYDTVDEFVRRRQPFRDAHLAHAQRALDAGRLVMAGALNPADGALLVFDAESPTVVEEFVRNDPYVQNGLVRSWRIREWTVVLGPKP